MIFDFNEVRRSRKLQAAARAAAEDLHTFSTRKLTVRPLALTDDIQPRPHAGRKSRRIHARTWELA